MFDFFRSRTEAEEPQYQILLEQEPDGTFVATSPALPGYVAYGTSEASAARRIKRAIRRNLEGYAADAVAASRELGDGRTSRHRTSLHFQLPLTTTAKIVLASLALAGAATLISLEARRRRDD
jgi:predicted RNase H-like HicB family nuclease